MTSIKPLKLGVRFDPAAIVLIYKDESSKKLHSRVFPAKDIDILTDLKVYSKTFCMIDKHKKYFEHINEKKLENVLFILQDHLKGYSLKESIARVKEKNLEKSVSKKQISDDEEEEDTDEFEDEEINSNKKPNQKIETEVIDDEDFSF